LAVSDREAYRLLLEVKVEGSRGGGTAMKCKCRGLLQPQATGRPRRYCSSACRQRAYRRRQRRSVHFRSDSAEWATPPTFFATLDREFGFTLDACATPANAKCLKYFTLAEDGLQQPWQGIVWCNPPYGRTIGLWLQKALAEVECGHASVVVCLVPARPDTGWWNDYAARGEIRFHRGRLKFGNARSGAPFPSAVVVFRNASGAAGALRNGDAKARVAG
jgi:site-specific DNA-methyltransferase (adenine-specific)